MPKISDDSRVSYKDISKATRISVYGVKSAAKRKDFNPHDLKSIAYYIVKKTLGVPLGIIGEIAEKEEIKNND